MCDIPCCSIKYPSLLGDGCLYCCCARPCLASIVDNVVLPWLGGKCCCGGPFVRNTCCSCVWLSCDKACCINNRDPNRESAQRKPIVVLVSITVKDPEQYAAAWTTYSTHAQASVNGVKAMFSFMDTKKEGGKTALQVFWYDSPDDFKALPTENLGALRETYAAASGDYLTAFGGWNDEMKDSLESMLGPELEYNFSDSTERGFIKGPGHPGRDPSKYPGPPIIWISKRNVKPGGGELIASAFTKAGDLQYYAAPAFLGGAEFTDLRNPDQLWSLRFFNDYEMGHVRHFPKGLSWIPPRVLFTMFPQFGPGPFPHAYSFSSRKDIDDAIAYNAGNKDYDQYIWEDGKVLGPLPDFSDSSDSTASPAVETRVAAPAPEVAKMDR